MNIFDCLDGPHPPCMVCHDSFGGCSGCAFSAHLCNNDGINYLKFEPSTTSYCEHFALSFMRNHQQIRSQCNIYELPLRRRKHASCTVVKPMHCQSSTKCIAVGMWA